MKNFYQLFSNGGPGSGPHKSLAQKIPLKDRHAMMAKAVSDAKQSHADAVRENPKDTSYHRMLESDHYHLNEVHDHYVKGEHSKALHHASRMETGAREQIPGAVWADIGGELSPTGVSELKKHIGKKA